MAKGAYIGVGVIYREVEYIQSSGTQYIDTGFKPNQDTRVVFSGHNLSTSSSWIYGIWHANGDTQFCTNGQNTYSVRYGSRSAQLGTLPVGDFEIDQNKNTYNYNGNTGTLTAQTFACSYPMYLFAINAAGSVSSGRFTGKLYSCKIYDNGTLVRDYIPVINSNNTAGLFDKVSKRFYANAGSGSFTFGTETGKVYKEAGVAQKIKKGYIGIENFKPVILPSGYTQVEYIQSSGTQYIDTGFLPKYNSRVVMDISGLGTAQQWLFGARNSGSSTASGQFCLYRSSATAIRADYFGTNASATISDTSARTVVERNANVVNAFGLTITNTVVSSGEVAYPLYLFTLNNVGTAHANKASIKLYSCQIYDNGTLIRDYVPCINSSGAAGLYDLVEAKFYNNAGTGAFTAGGTQQGVAHKIKKAYIGIGGGATYREVEYIESSGTQYIDTGFKANQDTKVIMDAHYTSTSVAHTTLFGGRTSATEKAYALNYPTTTGHFRYFYNNAYESSSLTHSPTERTTIIADKNTITLGAYSHSWTYASFQCDYNMLLFAMNAAGTVQWHASARLYSCQIYDNGKLIRDFVPVINGNGTPGLFDKVSKLFYANNGAGNFTAGAETGNTYVSNGVARPCWAGGELTYYGKATALSSTAGRLAATTVGNHALFGGGESRVMGTRIAIVNAYDSKLTRSIPTALSLARCSLAAATVGNYAIFAGGTDINGEASIKSTVDAYDSSLTKVSSITAIGARADLASVSFGDYALFAGGRSSYNSSSDTYTASNTVYAYNPSLTRSTASSGLSVSRYYLAAAAIGNYALFAGGLNGSSRVDTVDAYNKSLTRSLPTALTQTKINLAATTVGNHALFAGGNYKTTSVDAYDPSLTKSIPTPMSVERYNFAATTVDRYALFVAGFNGGNKINTVDIYDDSLVRSVGTNIPTAKTEHAATSIGDYALIAGGEGSGETCYSDVDVYAVV